MFVPFEDAQGNPGSGSSSDSSLDSPSSLSPVLIQDRFHSLSSPDLACFDHPGFEFTTPSSPICSKPKVSKHKTRLPVLSGSRREADVTSIVKKLQASLEQHRIDGTPNTSFKYDRLRFSTIPPASPPQFLPVAPYNLQPKLPAHPQTTSSKNQLFEHKYSALVEPTCHLSLKGSSQTSPHTNYYLGKTDTIISPVLALQRLHLFSDPSLKIKHEATSTPMVQPKSLAPISCDLVSPSKAHHTLKQINTGRRKAILIGINYFGTEYELKGCINDVHNMKNFLISTYNFPVEGMVIMTDDKSCPPERRPTRKNIIAAMKWLTDGARPNDSLFFHFFWSWFSDP
ncbi:Ca(2+)-dependent cysteine protease [Entomophthora muscae]|uniref:Ca(2+)-dependent cysteine protease n=1 Tax=Entomophthora muscae TaxID=34485 RepID=A0ACC2RJ12_9FUNG|nr:Ca(2+)-dependent cysteine protease [Entomophthora muscae]